MTFNIKSRLELIFRFFLGGIFIWASWNKIAEPEEFARIVENYRILPTIFINPFALILPWVEMLCGIALIGGYLVKGSVVVVNTMLAVFIVAIIINMIRGVDITCGCFSVSGKVQKEMYEYLFRDFFLLFAGIWVLYYRLKIERVNSLSTL